MVDQILPSLFLVNQTINRRTLASRKYLLHSRDMNLKGTTKGQDLRKLRLLNSTSYKLRSLASNEVGGKILL